MSPSASAKPVLHLVHISEGAQPLTTCFDHRPKRGGQANNSQSYHFANHHHHHLSLNREGRWGTTDDFATSFLHFLLFSTALWHLANSRPVHSLMLSSHLFLCLPRLLPLFTVPCKMVLARTDVQEARPYHCSLRLSTIVRRSDSLLDLGTDFLFGNTVLV